MNICQVQVCVFSVDVLRRIYTDIPIYSIGPVCYHCVSGDTCNNDGYCASATTVTKQQLLLFKLLLQILTLLLLQQK